MAFTYNLHSIFRPLLRSLATKLTKRDITSNQIILYSMFLSIAIGGILTHYHDQRLALLLLPTFLLLRLMLQSLVEILAREHNKNATLETLLTELGDAVSDAALYLPLALFAGISAPLMVLVTVLALITEMSGIIPAQIGAHRRYEGPMGRSDRAFALGIFSFFFGLGWFPLSWVNPCLITLLVLLCITITNRTRSALRETHR